MNAKRFALVCPGMLMLAVAYHLGASRAGAQGSGVQFTGITVDPTGSGSTVVITANGDVCAREGAPLCSSGPTMHWWDIGDGCGWTYMGSVLGGTVHAKCTPWSGVKDGFRK